MFFCNVMKNDRGFVRFYREGFVTCLSRNFNQRV